MEITIDLHGYTVNQAKKEIEQTIAKAGKNVSQIVLIHGYHGGNALKEFVRSPNGIRSRRIKRRKYTMNQGQTIIELL